VAPSKCYIIINIKYGDDNSQGPDSLQNQKHQRSFQLEESKAGMRRYPSLKKEI
jgi:hypothetical protein